MEAMEIESKGKLGAFNLYHPLGFNPIVEIGKIFS